MRKFELMILILLFLLTACTPQAAAVTPTAIPATKTPPPSTSTPAPTSTLKPEPSPIATEITEEVVLVPPENLEDYIVSKMQTPMHTFDNDRYQMTEITNFKISPEDIHLDKFKLSDDYEVHAYATGWTIDQEGNPVYYNVPILVKRNSDNSIFQLGTMPMKYEFPLTEKMVNYFLFDNPRFKSEIMFKIQFTPMTKGVDSPNPNEVGVQKDIDFWLPLLKDIYTEESIKNFSQTADPSKLQLKNLSDELPARFIIPISAFGHNP